MPAVQYSPARRARAWIESPVILAAEKQHALRVVYEGVGSGVSISGWTCLQIEW